MGNSISSGGNSTPGRSWVSTNNNVNQPKSTSNQLEGGTSAQIEARASESTMLQHAPQQAQDAAKRLKLLMQKMPFQSSKPVGTHAGTTEKGNAEAQYRAEMGMMYAAGHRGLDAHEAAIHAQMAAKQNDPEALYFLGEMHLNERAGIVGIMDKKAGVDSIKRAADGGYAPAQFKLGQMLVNGETDTQNDKPNYQEEEAAYYFAEAAAQGHTEAPCELAKLYVNRLARLKGGKSPNAAADQYKQAASKGMVAQLELGKLYNVRGDIKPGPEANRKFAGYLTLAASQEGADPRIAYELAELYACLIPGLESGREGEKLAIKWYTQAANNGLPDAQYKLSYMYFHRRVDGLTDQECVAMAEKLLVKAGKNGQVDAQRVLGRLHFNSTPGLMGWRGKGANDTDAARYLQMAAKQNDPEALYFLGEMHLNERAGIVGIMDKKAGVDSIKRAADGGYAPAQFKLAHMHLDSLVRLPVGATADRKIVDETVQLLETAAEQEHPQACYELGNLHEQPRFGLTEEPNLKTAVKWYRVAAKAKVSSAQYRLGMLYRSGKVEGVDEQGAWNEAKRLLKAASDQGHVHARFYYGEMLVDDARNDYKTAMQGRKLLEAAAGQGDPDLQYKFAIALLDKNPEGEKELIRNGMKWLEMAAKRGHAKAFTRLGREYLKMEPVPDYQAAWGCFENAADKEDIEAINLLGWMCEVGLDKELASQESNPCRAVEYYKLAAAKGDGHALFKLGELTEAGYNGLIEKGEEGDRKAVEYYQQAAYKGNDEAKRALEDKAAKGNAKAIDALKGLANP